MTRGITPQLAEQHLDALTEIVARAAAATLATPFSSVARRIKPDLSPVTAADEMSEAVILEGLAALLPGIPVIAEESVGRASEERLDPSFIVVDPLDGTREFLAGRDEFTVNVGIVTNGVPIAGIIAAPAQGLLWRGVVGGRAERLRLRLGADPPEVYDGSFDPHATGAATSHRGDLAQPSRRADRGFFGPAAAGRALFVRLLGEVLLHRPGRSRSLSATVAYA